MCGVDRSKFVLWWFCLRCWGSVEDYLWFNFIFVIEGYYCGLKWRYVVEFWFVNVCIIFGGIYGLYCDGIIVWVIGLFFVYFVFNFYGGSGCYLWFVNN